MSHFNQKIKSFILSEYLEGEPEENLTDTLELLQDGILDSMAVLGLVNFVEEEWDIEVEPDEATETNFGTIESMARFVEQKVTN